jgi:hypothetical protein
VLSRAPLLRSFPMRREMDGVAVSAPKLTTNTLLAQLAAGIFSSSFDKKFRLCCYLIDVLNLLSFSLLVLVLRCFRLTRLKLILPVSGKISLL